MPVTLWPAAAAFGGLIGSIRPELALCRVDEHLVNRRGLGADGLIDLGIAANYFSSAPTYFIGGRRGPPHVAI